MPYLHSLCVRASLLMTTKRPKKHSSLSEVNTMQCEDLRTCIYSIVYTYAGDCISRHVYTRTVSMHVLVSVHISCCMLPLLLQPIETSSSISLFLFSRVSESHVHVGVSVLSFVSYIVVHMPNDPHPLSHSASLSGHFRYMYIHVLSFTENMYVHPHWVALPVPYSEQKEVTDKEC